jgi:hypothetical protein
VSNRKVNEQVADKNIASIRRSKHGCAVTGRGAADCQIWLGEM